MTGSLSIQEANYESKKHDVLIIRQTKQVLVFTDPRQFGRIRIHRGSQEPPWWSELPIGMLDDSFQVDFLINTILRHPRKPIKALLLDQRYFTGNGELDGRRRFFENQNYIQVNEVENCRKTNSNTF